jgi:small-conductance mechanosensitive channel
VNPDVGELLGRYGDNRFLTAAVILAVTLIAVWIIDFSLTRVLPRLAKRTRTDVDDRLIPLLKRPIRMSVLVAGLALVTLHLDPSSMLEEGALELTELTLSLLATIAILLWMVASVRIAGVLLIAASSRSRWVESRTLPLFRNLATFAIVGGAVYFLFVTWGINIAAWAASAGIVGIAVGFAAKDSLANFFAGIFILTDAPYKVGDWVVLGTGERGQVTHVGIRSTRLLTRDDVEVTIPNAIIGNALIVNESSGRWIRKRLRVAVGVAYGSDIDRVRAVLEEVAIADPDVCEDPEPRMRFRAFGASGLDLELLVWIDDPADTGRISDQLHSAVYKRLAAEGIEIPYPKRDVYVRELPARAEPPSAQ